MGSPVRYPDLDPSVRSRLLNFIFGVLAADEFDPTQVNRTVERRALFAFGAWATLLPASGKSTVVASLKAQLAARGLANELPTALTRESLGEGRAPVELSG